MCDIHLCWISFQISDHGYIAFNSADDLVTLPDPDVSKRSYAIIAPYMGYMRGGCEGSSIFVTSCLGTNTATDAADKIVNSLTIDPFEVKQCYQVTWYNMNGCDWRYLVSSSE